MTGAFLQLLPAMALPPRLEPYKKLLGVLVRQNCISIAVSNPYLNLAEPLGAVMLREGRLPGRSFQRLLAPEQQQLAGFVMAFEVQEPEPQQQQQQQEQEQAPITEQQQAAAAQVRAALQSLQPGLLGGWYGGWSAAAAGASCRITPPDGPLVAPAAAMHTPGITQQQQQQGRVQQQVQQAGESSLGVVQAGQGASQKQGVQQQQQQQPVCSLGQQFLQSYLDSLGALNTFG